MDKNQSSGQDTRGRTSYAEPLLCVGWSLALNLGETRERSAFRPLILLFLL